MESGGGLHPPTLTCSGCESNTSFWSGCWILWQIFTSDLLFDKEQQTLICSGIAELRINLPKNQRWRRKLDLLPK